MTQLSQFDNTAIGSKVTGPAFYVTAETIKEFAHATLDFNPLHLDDKFMQGNFGKTNFDGVIMHGMTNFALITRTIVDWAEPIGGITRRLETRWRMPVKPGDTIQPTVTVKSKKTTVKSQWLTLDVEVKNQRGDVVATGDAMVEMPS